MTVRQALFVLAATAVVAAVAAVLTAWLIAG
jgi:hypothetical protein